MDDKCFKTFVEILQMIKRRESEHSSIEETIIDLIDHFENELTEEQKAKILEDLVSYERKRRQRTPTRSMGAGSRDYF